MKKMMIFLWALVLIVCVGGCDFFSPEPIDEGNEAVSAPHSSILLKKPPKVKDDQAPVIEALWVEQAPVPTLPGEGVKIHYRVTDNVDIGSISIRILYDPVPDNQWHVMFASRVLRVTLDFPGVQTEVESVFTWDGSVDTQFSATGTVFNQLAMEPDQYLFFFEVKDASGKFAHNMIIGEEDDGWIQAPEEEVILCQATEQRPAFCVTDMQASWVRSKKKAGKYKATLRTDISCSVPGFSGWVQWLRVEADGSLSPLDKTERDGTPNQIFTADAGSNVATPAGDFLVGPGRYRCVLRNIYQPAASFNPWDIMAFMQGPEPWAEVVVE